ncbi:WXG100 family type VII secretion target [Salininema proteolyticum]|uniref:WXG100 family type VII secretion target n=1 Tax=Salininema proteolyticum TaxID=1607685 RepID=A0ABV8U390_9ACTN
MADGIQVEPDDLRNHAARIDQLRDRFQAIKDAMNQVQQDDEAFGILCQFLPPILQWHHDDQTDLTDLAEENLDLLAQALNHVATQYEDTDTAVGNSFDAILKEL